MVLLSHLLNEMNLQPQDLLGMFYLNRGVVGALAIVLVVTRYVAID
jgi:hypothetical protein